MDPGKPSLDSIAGALLALLDDDTLADLRTEDPAVAIEFHFEPLRVRALPVSDFRSSECATDGFYDTGIGTNPWIFVAEEVTRARMRFTLIHELGHHLLATSGARLLDDIDRVAGLNGEAQRVEETVCHRFAGRVLVPDELIEAIVGDAQVRPQHLVDLHERSTASWEAVAVRATGNAAIKTAVVLIRNPGRVGFCAASSRLGWSWWPRGSEVASGGPLSKALRIPQRALVETYRNGLPFAETLYCDTLPIHEDLAVAVLTERPSDGRLNILDAVEPGWTNQEDFCPRCGEERNTRWCSACTGRRCWSCGGCGCSSEPIDNPLCPECDLRSPFRKGARVCLTCEADGLS